ncbi:MAG TPA: DoxX family membrane protein [Opitutaceae bacterium]|jgi:thiosulfate dehydrogenase [quinone] large subunit
MSETPDNRFAGPAHALARICLGLNIFLHGLVRIPHVGAFAGKLQHQFAETFLSPGLIQGSAYAIVAGETVIGLLVLLGLGLRGALIAGTLLMILLQLGTALIQDWTVATQQLIYVGFYVGLLATLRYDTCSLDRWRARP